MKFLAIFLLLSVFLGNVLSIRLLVKKNSPAKGALSAKLENDTNTTTGKPEVKLLGKNLQKSSTNATMKPDTKSEAEDMNEEVIDNKSSEKAKGFTGDGAVIKTAPAKTANSNKTATKTKTEIEKTVKADKIKTQDTKVIAELDESVGEDSESPKEVKVDKKNAAKSLKADKIKTQDTKVIAELDESVGEDSESPKEVKVAKKNGAKSLKAIKEETKPEIKKMERKKSDLPPCAGPLLLTMDVCCDAPVLSKELVTACSGRKSAMKSMLGSVLSNTKSQPAAAPAGGLLGKLAGMGPGSSAVCVAECIIRNSSMLTDAGEVDTKKYEAFLLKSASEEWKPILYKAFLNCSVELAQLSPKELAATSPILGGNKCKPSPFFYTTCVRRYNLLNCPTKYLNTKDKSCAAKIEALKNCDPFSVPSPAKVLQVFNMGQINQFASDVQQGMEKE